MSNKKLFYHAANDVLFTCTKEISEKEFLEEFEIVFKAKKIPFIKGSAQVGEWGGVAEPGDTADLM
jgi:hypothetical protein